MSAWALVTGATGAIGAAVARTLAQEGFSLILHGNRNREALAALQTYCQEVGTASERWECDLSDAEAVREGVQQVVASRPVKVFIHCAGGTRDGLMVRYREEELRRLFQVHFFSAYQITQAVLRSMIQNRYGRIVYMGSSVALSGNAGQTAYAAAKMALVGLARALAREVGKRGITVNVVAPGWVQTPMTEGLIASRQEEIRTQVPVGRVSTPEEVAALVRFLTSSQAGYITGQTILLNGGMWMV